MEDVQMKYFEFGQGNPELMVMLPGGGVCYRRAIPIAEEMAKVYHVLVCVYALNGARGFVQGFWQLLVILSVMNLIDRFLSFPQYHRIHHRHRKAHWGRGLFF